MKLPSLVFLFGCLTAGSFVPAAEPDAADVLGSLLAINDQKVEAALRQPRASRGGGLEHRMNGVQLSTLAASYTSARSRLHHDARLLPAMQALVAALRQSQLDDGLFDSGNLDSPPDTAFILETLCQAQSMLGRDANGATTATRDALRDLILKAAEGVRTGGVHTPNHRWHVCAALAHVNRLYPDARLIARIDDWLGEGIDLDADGQYAERSPHYTAEVVNPALITLALLLDRPKLLDYVRRNLAEMLYLIEPNGELETVASRRQDQRTGAREFIWAHYVSYRIMAVRDGNGEFAAVARWIEREFLANTMATFSPNAPLAMFLDHADLARELPAVAPLRRNFTHVFAGMAMARVRHDDTSATIYGGSDAGTHFGVGSGLAMNPTFFRFRKGAAVLDSVRMTPAFFSTGFFYSDGLQIVAGGYELRQIVKVPYHLPLPTEFRRARGDYPLSDDGRFFSRLDFAHRPKQFRTLSSKVGVSEREGGFELEFTVDGLAGVPVTIELAFRRDGTLAGTEPLPAPTGAPSGRRGGDTGEDRADRFVLRSGTGTFSVGADTIEFGPGTAPRPPGRMEGENYTWVNGHQRAEGYRVYLTGLTPFHHTLTIR